MFVFFAFFYDNNLEFTNNKMLFFKILRFEVNLYHDILLSENWSKMHIVVILKVIIF
jgi:hypothetical protein